jgi:hypothetical protein
MWNTPNKSPFTFGQSQTLNSNPTPSFSFLSSDTSATPFSFNATQPKPTFGNLSSFSSPFTSNHTPAAVNTKPQSSSPCYNLTDLNRAIASGFQEKCGKALVEPFKEVVALLRLHPRFLDEPYDQQALRQLSQQLCDVNT